MDTKYGIHCRDILGCRIMNAVGIPWCLPSCWKSGRLAVAQQWHRCGGNWYTITSWDKTLGLHWATIWPIREPYLAFRQEVNISNCYLFVVTIHTSDMQYVSLANSHRQRVPIQHDLSPIPFLVGNSVHCNAFALWEGTQICGLLHHDH